MGGLGTAGLERCVRPTGLVSADGTSAEGLCIFEKSSVVASSTGLCLRPVISHIATSEGGADDGEGFAEARCRDGEDALCTSTEGRILPGGAVDVTFSVEVEGLDPSFAGNCGSAAEREGMADSRFISSAEALRERGLPDFLESNEPDDDEPLLSLCCLDEKLALGPLFLVVNTIKGLLRSVADVPLCPLKLPLDD